MNSWFLAAGIASLATAAIHAFLGGPEVDAVIQSTEALHPVIRAVSAVIWHGLTALFLINGLWLLAAAMGRAGTGAVAVIAANYAAFAALFIVFNWARFGSLMVLPQWILFGAMVALMVVGLTRAAA